MRPQPGEGKLTSPCLSISTRPRRVSQLMAGTPRRSHLLPMISTMHGGAPSAIAEVCIDMSPAFIKGIANSSPAAAITFDKFHAVKIVNDAVDQVRRAERKVHNVLAGTRYLWLRNPVNLSDRQRAAFENLPLRHLKTARAYRIRLAFQELYDQPTPDAATVFLKKWDFWATHSGCRQSSMPRALSSATGTASCAGSTADSQWPHRGDQ